MGTIPPELLFEGIRQSPKTTQTTDTASVGFPETEKTDPPVRTPHTSDTGLGEIKQELTQEVPLTTGFFGTGRHYEACLV